MLEMKSTTAMATLGSGDAAYILHRIEGYRFNKVGWGTPAPMPITIGFWISTTQSGTFTVAVTNFSSNRSYVAEVTSVAGAWQYKTVTIPGDATGSWPIANTTGLGLYFVFACGTGLQIPANTWTAGFKLGTAASTNFFRATNDQVFLTGVVVLPGTEAPSAARSALIMRPYDQELVTCKRYYEIVSTTQHTFSGNITSGSIYFRATPYQVEKRLAPTITLVDSGNSTYFNTATGTINSGVSGFTESRAATGTGNGSFSSTAKVDARL